MSTPYPPSALMKWDGWLTVQTASCGCDCPLYLHASRLGTAPLCLDMSRFDLQCVPMEKQGKGLHHLFLPWMNVLYFWLFFCILIITSILSASSKLSDGAKMSCPSMKNLMLRKHKSFMHFIFLRVTFKYLQEEQAKKAVPTVICTIALSNSVTCHFAKSSRTEN